MFLQGPYFSAEGALGLPKANPGENTVINYLFVKWILSINWPLNVVADNLRRPASLWHAVNLMILISLSLFKY